VTDRVKAQRELAEALHAKEVLLHEVNHRVKNSLQIVTGLLMLQASQARDPALRQSLLEARGRISVVAAMHQRLYTTSQHDRVDFGEYVRDLAAETLVTLGGESRIALESSIEPGIMVVLQHAVPLALVVSELVTNAVKYAFPEEKSGTIRLFLQRDGNEVVLDVADDGIGLPDGFDPNKRSGLGMRIVTSLVKQVRGRLDVSSSDRGASFLITLNADQMN
jgi:two-component sensor histidine kinase